MEQEVSMNREEKFIGEGHPVEDPAEKSGTTPMDIFSNRNFRLLWIGQAISLLGDQFGFIALPWLVLKLTGDGLAVGAILAVMGIPRALFMLIGGALTDRFSPKAVMLASNLARFGLVALLAASILTGVVELWMLFLFALLFGLADAFFLPAEGAIVPRLVDEKNLQTANAIIQGTAQFSLFLGPVLAGGLIALFSSGEQAGGATNTELRGIGLALAFDAITFLVSAGTLWLIDSRRSRETDDATEAKEPVFGAIRDILVYVWRDKTLRYFFLVVATVATLVNSLTAVGVPVMADTRLTQGAAAYGLIMSAYGAGSLLGIGLAGVLPKPREGQLGTILLFATALGGVGLVLLGLVNTLGAAAFTALMMGTGLGYVVIQFTTWLQIRTPEKLLGRMMSILMFAAMGLTPIATAVVGVLIEVSLTGLFIGTGLLLLMVVMLAMTNATVRAMSTEAAT